MDTFSLTCSKRSWRALLVVVAYRAWVPVTVDIYTAVPQGRTLEREVYVKPPAELYAPGKLLRLCKGVYGLVDASLHPYCALHTAMMKIGAGEVILHPAIYLFFNDSRL